MPYTLGESLVDIEAFDWLVPVDAPIPELKAEPLDDASTEIGQHVARLIPDGATLQTGIGKIPRGGESAVGTPRSRHPHRNASDGVVDPGGGGGQSTVDARRSCREKW